VKTTGLDSGNVGLAVKLDVGSRYKLGLNKLKEWNSHLGGHMRIESIVFSHGSVYLVVSLPNHISEKLQTS